MDETASASFTAFVAVILGMIDQGAVDRKKLRDFVLKIIDDMTEADRRAPYGKLLQKVADVLALPMSSPPQLH